MKTKIIIALVLFISVIKQTEAQTLSKDSDSIEYKLLDEVVVLSTRFGNQQNPNTYNLKKDDVIVKSSAESIPRLINFLPSIVYSSDDGTAIGYSSIRIRGSDATRIGVNINDVPLSDGESHSVYWVNLPDIISFSKDIQISKGASASMNGTSLGGSVNIALDDFEKTENCQVSFFTGSYYTKKLSVAYNSGAIKDKFFIQAKLSKIYSDGYVDRAFSDLFSYFINLGYLHKNTSIKLLLLSGEQKTYQAWNGITKQQMEQNRSFNSAGAIYDENYEKIIAFYPNETDNYKQDNLQLHINQKINDFKIRFTTFYTLGRGFYENYKQDAKLKRYLLDRYLSENQNIQTSDIVAQKHLYNHLYGFIASVFYEKNKFSLNYSAAFSDYYNRHFGRVVWTKEDISIDSNHEFYSNSANKKDANTYLKLSYEPIKNLFLNADVQYRFVQYRVEGSEDKNTYLSIDKTYNFFSPKFSALYSFYQHNSIFFSYARAQKEPSRSDLKDSDKDIKYEELNDVEIAYLFDYQNFSFKTNFFSMFYKNQIVQTGELSETGYALRQNVEDSYRIGAETEISYAPFKWWDISINATFSKNIIKNYNETLKNTHISYSPSIVGAFISEFEPIKNFKIALCGKYVGKQFVTNENLPESKLEDYFVADAKLYYETKIKQISLGINVDVNNIFNKKYSSNAAFSDTMYYFPQSGTYFLIGITLR